MRYHSRLDELNSMLVALLRSLHKFACWILALLHRRLYASLLTLFSNFKDLEIHRKF